MKKAPEVTISQGQKGSPLCLFIHGLGMNKNIWVDPQSAMLLGGSFPITVFLSEQPTTERIENSAHKIITTGSPLNSLKTTYHDLKEKGYTVMAYSQKRPDSDWKPLIKEFSLLLTEYSKWTEKGVILITHSRGGLIARKAMELLGMKCIALVTIATPHQGSNLARLAGILGKASGVISYLFKETERGTVKGTLIRVVDFLNSRALKELIPDSPFIAGLDSKRLKAIKTLSVGGANPTLFTLYRLYNDTSGYKKMFSFPEILTSVIPDRFLPEEVRDGEGDGLVATVSSELPYALEHYNFHMNHAQLLFDTDVRERINAFIEIV